MAKKKAKTRKKAAKPKQKAVKVSRPTTHVKVTIKKKVFGEAPEEHTFMLNDGRKLKNVYELIDELETMSEDVFKNHVNDSKNDFANWLKDVFDEKSLAEELQQMNSRIETQRAIMKSIMRELKSLEPPEKHKIKHTSKCVIC